MIDGHNVDIRYSTLMYKILKIKTAEKLFKNGKNAQLYHCCYRSISI